MHQSHLKLAGPFLPPLALFFCYFNSGHGYPGHIFWKIIIKGFYFILKNQSKQFDSGYPTHRSFFVYSISLDIIRSKVNIFFIYRNFVLNTFMNILFTVVNDKLTPLREKEFVLK